MAGGHANLRQEQGKRALYTHTGTVTAATALKAGPTELVEFHCTLVRTEAGKARPLRKSSEHSRAY